MALSVDTILKLPTPHKAGIVALIAVLILGCYWQGFHRQRMKRITAKESKLNDLIRDRNIKDNIAKDKDKFKAELAHMNDDLQNIITKLPDKKEIPALLKGISNMSQEAGLEVLLFKPQGEQAEQFYSRVPVELKFVGSYHKIGMFFYYVGTLPRIVNIENFSITNAQQKKKDELMLNTSCIATTYRYAERATAPPPQGKPPQGKKK
jgi:type IV pilus assembly protein PilO